MYAFGIALSSLKNGARVRRAAWADGTFIYVVPTRQINPDRAPLANFFPETDVIECVAHINMCDINMRGRVWGPTHDDLLNNDWEIIS